MLRGDLNNKIMETVIIMASSIKEAKEHAIKEYGNKLVYEKPYRYASKGNNFYQFIKIKQ